jgi:hypothetical protein
MSALAHPENDNLPVVFDRCLDQIHGLRKSGIKTRSHRSNLGYFDLHHFARPRKVIHAAFLERHDGYSILILQLDQAIELWPFPRDHSDLNVRAADPPQAKLRPAQQGVA